MNNPDGTYEQNIVSSFGWLWLALPGFARVNYYTIEDTLGFR